MYSRWFNVAVVLLWLSATGWLVTEKFLPPLRVGKPPGYKAILEAQRDDPRVGWSMSFNGEPLGWAVSTAKSLPGDLMEIRSRVHFHRVPLEELIPSWLRIALRLVEYPKGNFRMDSSNTTVVDLRGRLVRFESEVRFEPLDDLIKMEGTIEGTKLRLRVRAGGLPYETEVDLPQDTMLSDAFSPRTQLPGLQLGQSWTAPVYSPLRPRDSPMEILQATVEKTESIDWDGRMVETLLVVYRSDSGFGLRSSDRPRGKLWVRGDGTVLKQRMMIFDSTMTFVRLSDDEAAELHEYVDRDQQQRPPT